MTAPGEPQRPIRLGARRWLLPYRNRTEPAQLTPWAVEQLEVGVVRAEDREQLVAELHRWEGTSTDRADRARPRHSA
jgi:hypothetical protein